MVIALRRLGDVLLTTPLIRTMRRGLPEARIDVLLFAGTEGILQGNPDIERTITMPERASLGETLKLMRRIAGRYDLVVSTQPGDRPVFLALVAGRTRVGLVPDDKRSWWKRWVFHRPVPVRAGDHRIVEVMRLAEALGLAGDAEVVCPAGGSAEAIAPQMPYAVLHPTPKFRYRHWTDAGWRVLARELSSRGLAVVVTGGSDAAERTYLDGLWRDLDPPVVRLDGQLDWPGLAALLAGAAVYVGVDTSMTHLAAASGCPTVALFGPTDPRLWGPWPAGGLDRAWDAAGAIQQRRNVWLVQNVLPCTPCQREGCERHTGSYSACLDDLDVRAVLAAADQALASRAAPSAGWRSTPKADIESAMTPPLVKQ